MDTYLSSIIFVCRSNWDLTLFERHSDPKKRTLSFKNDKLIFKNTPVDEL